MTAPETATFSQFAVIAGYKPGYITALRKDGRLVLTEDGKRVKVAESIQLIKDTKDPARIAVARRHAEARAATAVRDAKQDSTEPTDERDIDDKPDSPYHIHRAETERYKALAAKRDYEVSMRELLPAKEVEGAIAGIVGRFRKAIERMPAELAPQVGPLSDELAIERLLSEAVAHALTEMSRQFAALAKENA